MSHTRKVSGRAIAAGVAALALWVASPLGVAGAGAAPGQERPERHCVVAVEGTDASGDYILSRPNCFSSFDAAVRSGGVEAPVAITPSNLDEYDAAVSAAGYIAIHYDFQSWGGGSLSISGAGCTGGGINLATASGGNWNNRFESSRHYCQSGVFVGYFNNSNYTGSSIYIGGTNSPSTLYGLNNLVSSIRYG